MEELGCQWVGSGELVTVYDLVPSPDGSGSSKPAFILEGRDPVTGVTYSFSMVRIWNDRFNGEWWPHAFLCDVERTGRTCQRVHDGQLKILGSN